jgi:hypothetical protein
MLEMLVVREYVITVSLTSIGHQSNNDNVAVFIGFLWVS